MSQIVSVVNFGYEGSLVDIDVDLRRGIPMVDVVGLSDGAVKELRERVRSAVLNSGLDFPIERVLISLSPADLRKEGGHFGLPVALAVLHEQDKDSEDVGADGKAVAVFGELELSGEVSPVTGLFAMLQTAKAENVRYAIVPEQGGALPDGIKVFKVKNLVGAREALSAIAKENEAAAADLDNGFGREFTEAGKDVEVKFRDTEDVQLHCDGIKGLDGLKYAMTASVAGGHHLLAIGKPGCGKTLLLQHLPELLPDLLPEEKASVNRIYSLAGIDPTDGKAEKRPFRMPHQTASIEGMCGGGTGLRAGEITLAHNGVLFLDEATEFKSSILCMLRVPMESRSITLSRAGRSTVFPAKFRLVMATNPCPCGNLGSKDKLCLCSSTAIAQYWKKVSAPLLDRVEIRLDCNDPADVPAGMDCTLGGCREMIARAWRTQYARQGKLNGDLDISEVAKYAGMDEDAERFFRLESEHRSWSPRTVSNVRKLARTLADMDGSGTVTEGHARRAVALHCSVPTIDTDI